MKSALVRFFTEDLARKLLALFFAVVLFDVLDRQVVADGKLTVALVFVDASGLDRVPESPDRSSRLLVAQRLSPEAPLVVDPQQRPDSLTLKLRAPRDAIDRALARRHDFVLRLAQEGWITPLAAELDGVVALRDELGPGASVEIQPPVNLLVEREETRAVVLDDEWLRCTGNLPPGWQVKPNSVAFKPSEIRLVGPASVVAAALARTAPLFDPVALEGGRSEVTQEIALAPVWRDRLRIEDGKKTAIASVRVTVRLERRMSAIPAPDGVIELPVHVVCNDDVLRRRDSGKSWKAGWRLRLVDAHDGELKLKLQLLAPELSVGGAALDRARLLLAKESVELIVRAHEAAGVDRTRLPVEIETFSDFPDELSFTFENGEQRAEVEVEWVPPSAPDVDKEKRGGNGE